MRKYFFVFFSILLIWSILYLTLGKDQTLIMSKQVSVNDQEIRREILKDTDRNLPNTITVLKIESQEDLPINLEPMNIERHVSLISVGDIMAHTMQFEAAKRPDGYEFYPQFEQISKKIKAKNIAVANLETVFAGEAARYSGKNMIFNAPDNLAASIKKAGFDVLTTANNHSLDRGYNGISRTIDTLEAFELLHTGTYRTEEESQEILIIEENNMTFALLSYSYSTNGWPIPTDHPYAINMMEETKILSDIRKAKSEDVDFILVAVHWGLEYHLEENRHQKALAEAIFYEGADIILGTHPHVIQPFEHKKMVDKSGLEKNKFIIYSQGNFISGQRTYPRAIGMFINFDFKKIGLDQGVVSQVSVMPTFVEATYKSGQRFMRILDVHQAQLDYLNNQLDISETLFRDLKVYEETFVSHIASRVEMTPYLNDMHEYVIYKE